MQFLRSVLAAAALVGAAFCLSGGSAEGQSTTTNRLTVYLLRGRMHSGQQTHWGAAACSWNYPVGTQLRLPDGWVVTCLDRGLLGSRGWIDIWAPDGPTGRAIQARYGNWTQATVVRWGW
jgi:hypothetical protein